MVKEIDKLCPEEGLPDTQINGTMSVPQKLFPE
jgi:hypothetical protein